MMQPDVNPNPCLLLHALQAATGLPASSHMLGLTFRPACTACLVNMLCML